MTTATPPIHPTAIIHPDAKIGKGVRVGPYCIIGPKVTLGDNVYLHSHVVIEDVNCTIGEGTELYPFVSINKTQDLKYKGEDSKIIIGKNNTIREYTTIQPGTAGDKMRTVIGDNCLLMACTHVAHDCILGNNILMANHATLAGHVTVEDYVIIGGLAAVHQFVTIGAHAIIGGMSGVGHDVIPYANVKGDRANLSGLNLVGLKRRGFNRDQIAQLRNAYDALFAVDDRPLTERIAALQAEGIQDEGVQQILDFVTRDNMRSLLMPKA